MKVDVDAVHRRICHLLAVIRSPSHAPAFLSIEKAAAIAKERTNQQLVQTQFAVYCFHSNMRPVAGTLLTSSSAIAERPSWRGGG